MPADACGLRRQCFLKRLDPEQLNGGDVERGGELDEQGTGRLRVIGLVVGDDPLTASLSTRRPRGDGGCRLAPPTPPGLQYRRARYYDPLVAQFTQLDPIGMSGGLNLYGYANLDPVNFSDPSGLVIESRTCERGQSVLTCEAGLELLDDSGWDIWVLAGPCGRRGWCPETIPELLAIPGFDAAVRELWGRTGQSMEEDPDGIGREYGGFILRLPSNQYQLSTIFRGTADHRILGLPRSTPANAIAFVHTHTLYSWHRAQTARVYSSQAASPADIENARIREIWVVTVSSNRLHFVNPAGIPLGYRPRN